MRKKSGYQSKKDWFKVVEIEVNSRCNRTCPYCPVSILPTPNVPEYMGNAIFHRIIEELEKVNFCGKISYHHYSEPLLRKDLEFLVRKAKKRLSKAYQLLYTNGDLLSEERYESLKAAGINHFLVTRHGFEHIPKRSDQSVRYPSDLIIVNRGGIVFKIEKPLSMPCYAPHEMLIVSVKGDILQCCEDAQRRYVMGNIMKQPLEEIWFSDQFSRLRELLRKGNREDASPICKNCSSEERVKPNQS